MLLALNFWRDAPTKIKRILTIAVFFLLSIIITVSGVLTPLTLEEADKIKKGFEEIQENVNIQLIFGNNFMICLIMFIPFAGPIFGSYVLYNTGVVIAAQGTTEGLPSLVVFLFLFIFPFTWLEFLSYSTALAESVWLTWRMIQHKGKKELVNTSILISICAVMLLAAAIIEFAVILHFVGLE